MSIPIIINGAGGRMGSIIAGLAQADPELKLAGVIERPGNEASLERYKLPAGTDATEVMKQVPGGVVIDFTAPEASVALSKKAAPTGNPVVCGTTGLTPEQRGELEKAAQSAPYLWAANMSLGINVLLKVLPMLTQMLGETYDMEMVELHHKMKKDAPSGTALVLAECLAKARDWELSETGKYCREGIIGERPHEEIGVQTIRGGDVVGVHTAYFMGPGERIEVTHQAHSRENFANGALRAAKWLHAQKPGKLYSMADVLG